LITKRCTVYVSITEMWYVVLIDNKWR